MGFGAKYRPNLEHALEYADHHLLVELRALGEVGRPAEVVEREHVRSALGCRGNDLGRLDLREAALGGLPQSSRGSIEIRASRQEVNPRGRSRFLGAGDLHR